MKFCYAGVVSPFSKILVEFFFAVAVRPDTKRHKEGVAEPQVGVVTQCVICIRSLLLVYPRPLFSRQFLSSFNL